MSRRGGYYGSEVERAAELDLRRDRLTRMVTELEAETASYTQLLMRVERAKLDRLTHETKAERIAQAVDAGPEWRRFLVPLHLDRVRFPRGPHIRIEALPSMTHVRPSFCESRSAPEWKGPEPLFVLALMPGPATLLTSITAAFIEEVCPNGWFRLSERMAAFILDAREGDDVSWLLGSARV